MKKITMSLFQNPEDENDYCAWRDAPVKYQHWKFLQSVAVEVPEKKTLYVYKDIHTGNYRIYEKYSNSKDLIFIEEAEIEE